MVQAVERAAAKVPLCAVIHTTLPPANQAPGRSSSPSSGAGAAPGVEPVQLAPTAAQLPGLGGLPPYFLLRQAVPHELLLPQVDLAVHHGGAGTTQAVLLAGRRPGRGGGVAAVGQCRWLVADSRTCLPTFSRPVWKRRRAMCCSSSDINRSPLSFSVQASLPWSSPACHPRTNPSGEPHQAIGIVLHAVYV